MERPTTRTVLMAVLKALVFAAAWPQILQQLAMIL